MQQPATLAGDGVTPRLQDAARTPGGHAPLVALPESEGEAAWVLHTAPSVLPVGAQSSLTGGATPFGEWVLATERFAGLKLTGSAGDPDRRVHAGAGVPLVTLAEELARHGLYYPPAPTYDGAFVGGTVATCAAGAATFKYGTTRTWVQGLTVVLADGDVLDIERGQCRAHPEGYFEVVSSRGVTKRLPVPTYRMPDVVKRSAGYHAEPEMDLVDLFIGAEGTLGVVTEVELRVVPAPVCASAWLTFDDERRALHVVGALREAAQATWRTRDPRGIDVAAIESLDRRSLALLREDGTDRSHGMTLAPGADTALIVQLDLPPHTDAQRALNGLGALDETAAPDTPLVRFATLLREHNALDEAMPALPGDKRQAATFAALREAVPEAVNRRVGQAQRDADPRIEKTAGDMVVPFEALEEMLATYREGFESRGLDHALWGHVSDGNLHANVIPKSWSDVEAGREALVEFGAKALHLGGCPLSEHGVGRSTVKQTLLRHLYGTKGIAEMRAVKATLDPHWKLAPGVLFPTTS